MPYSNHISNRIRHYQTNQRDFIHLEICIKSNQRKSFLSNKKLTNHIFITKDSNKIYQTNQIDLNRTTLPPNDCSQVNKGFKSCLLTHWKNNINRILMLLKGKENRTLIIWLTNYRFADHLVSNSLSSFVLSLLFSLVLSFHN